MKELELSDYYDVVKDTKNYNRALARTNLNCDILMRRISELPTNDHQVDNILNNSFRGILWNHIIQAYYKDYGIDIIPESCGNMYGYFVMIIQKSITDSKRIADLTSGSLRFDFGGQSYETLKELCITQDLFITVLKVMKYLEDKVFANSIFSNCEIKTNDEVYTTIYQILTIASCMGIVDFWILGAEHLPQYLRDEDINAQFQEYFEVDFKQNIKCFVHRSNGTLYYHDRTSIEYNIWCNDNVGQGVRFIQALQDEKEKVMIMNATVGGFSGSSFKVKIDFLAKSCEYISFEHGFSNEVKENIKLDNAKLIQLGENLLGAIITWKKQYTANKSIMDGTNRSVELISNKERYDSDGSNCYPKEWDHFCGLISSCIERKFI